MVRRRRAISAVAAAAALCSADARRPAAARGRPAPARPSGGAGRSRRRGRRRRAGDGGAGTGPAAAGPEEGASSHLTTAFSCGSVWTRANTCGILCPTGRDDACPDGEACYAGMDCAASDRDVSDVLAEQRALERAELGRLAESRSASHVERFVCGASYDDAALRCSAGADPPQLGRGVRGDGGAHYCPSGSSGACPGGTECYAAVPCPASTHAPEVPALADPGRGPGGTASPTWIAVRGVTEAVLPAGNRTEGDAGGVGGSDGVRPPEPSPPAGFWATALTGLVGPC